MTPKTLLSAGTFQLDERIALKSTREVETTGMVRRLSPWRV